MIPAGYIQAAPVTCVHVECAGDVCRYVAPAIGPELPWRVTSSDGVVWQRHGSIFYGPNNGAHGRIATWHEVVRAADTAHRYGLDKFPKGSWTVQA